MKFFCEYCGNRIDAEKDHKCPHCGASYKKNKNFIKLEEEKNKEKQINNEYKQKIFNHIFDSMKFSRRFAFIPVAIFVIVLITIISVFITINKSFDSVFDSEKIEEEPITVGINEYGETANYKAKVTKYEVVEDIFGDVEEGYELIKFHLMVENLTNGQIYKEDVNCIVEGIAQTNDFSSGYSDLPMFIARGLTVTGTATFMVPKDATSYDIRYGDYITIHIEK